MRQCTSRCDEEPIAVNNNLDTYENPPSNLSMTSSTCQNDNKGDGKAPPKMATLKVEYKKGDVVVKEGRAGWDRLSPVTQHEIREALVWATEYGSSASESNKAETLYHEVEDFFGKTKEPPVKELRAGIPKATFLLYHFQEAIEGREKVKNLWHENSKPADWPRNVRFEDPNNASGGSKGKLVRTHLIAMYRVVKRDFELHHAEIKRKVEEHMAASPRVRQENYPVWHQKLTAERLRTEATLAELSQQVRGSQPQLATDLHEFKNWLEENLSPDMADGERVKYLEACLHLQKMGQAVLIKNQPCLDGLTGEMVNFQVTYMQGLVRQPVQPQSMDAGQLHFGQDLQRPASEQKLPETPRCDRHHIESMEVNRQFSTIDVPVVNISDSFNNSGKTVPIEVNDSKDEVDWGKHPSFNLEAIRDDQGIQGFLDSVIYSDSLCDQVTYSDSILKHNYIEPSTMLMDTNEMPEEFNADATDNQAPSAVTTDNANIFSYTSVELAEDLSDLLDRRMQEMEGVQGSSVWLPSTRPEVPIPNIAQNNIPVMVEDMLT